MEKEDDTKGKSAHNEKNENPETCCKLLKSQEKNGILSWKSTEKKMLQLQINEAEQQSLEARNERLSLISCEEISKPLLLLFEDNAEDFNIELTPFNDLWDTSDSDLVSCNEYLPYYRTDANLLEVPQYINTRVKQENMEGEGGIQSNGCAFKSIYEDETLNDTDLVTGHVPYYQSYEEYFGSPALTNEVPSRADSEETEINSTEEIESEIDGEIAEVFESSIGHGKCITDEYVNQHTEELKHLLPGSIVNPCDSEFCLFDEILSLNQSSSSGYFPYYKTYGQLFLN